MNWCLSMRGRLCSAGTTDFTVKMQVPLTNVTRSDLVQVAISSACSRYFPT